MNGIEESRTHIISPLLYPTVGLDSSSAVTLNLGFSHPFCFDPHQAPALLLKSNYLDSLVNVKQILVDSRVRMWNLYDSAYFDVKRSDGGDPSAHESVYFFDPLIEGRSDRIDVMSPLRESEALRRIQLHRVTVYILLFLYMLI